MNCLNYELSQNLNWMYTNKNVCPFDVSSSINHVLSLEYVLTHSMQCFVYLQHFPGIDSISLLKLSFIVPKAPTTATTFVLTFHILEISTCSISTSFLSLFSTHLCHQVPPHPQSSNFDNLCSGLSQVCLRESVNIVLSHIMTLSSIFVTFSGSCI